MENADLNRRAVGCIARRRKSRRSAGAGRARVKVARARAGRPAHRVPAQQVEAAKAASAHRKPPKGEGKQRLIIDQPEWVPVSYKAGVDRQDSIGPVKIENALFGSG